MSKLKTEILTGRDIESHIEELARLRIEVFRDFPYLYDGDLAYEKNYLNRYVSSPESIAVLVFDGDRAVGASTGLPMDHEEEDFRRPFMNAGIDTSSIFYCGESVLLKSHRGRGIYSEFFRQREEHARSLGRFESSAFCGVVRPDDHPMRPDDYRPLDLVWKRYGYKRRLELTTTYHWKDLGEDKESDKEMIFWTKAI